MQRFTETEMVLAHKNDSLLVKPFQAVLNTIFVPDATAFEGIQNIHLTTITPNNPTGTVIVGPAMGERQNRDFQEWRLAIIAEILGMRAIGYDFPVMGGDIVNKHNTLSRLQIAEARRLGSFSYFGANVWEAIRLLDGEKHAELMQNTTIWGDSMGAFLSGGLIKSVPKELCVKDLVLIEPAGLEPLAQKYKTLSLLAAFATSSTGYEYYVGMNPEHSQVGVTPMYITAGRIALHPNAAFRVPVGAMARGGLTVQLENGLRRSDKTRVHIFHGELDKVSPIGLNEQLEERLKRMGILVTRTCMLGEVHGPTDSMAVVAAIAEQVRSAA